MSKAFARYFIITAWIVFGFALASYNQVSLAAFLPFSVPQGGTGGSSYSKYPLVGNGNGSLVASSTLWLNSINATSTTATSTIAGFLDVNGTGTNATSTIASNLWIKGSLQIGTASIYLTSAGINITD